MAQEHNDELTEVKHLYVLGPLLENILQKIRKICPDFRINYIEGVRLSFAKEISILGLGIEGYNSGQGLGSQYLAEVMTDYGISGVIIYSLLLGVCISVVSDFYKYNFLGFSLSLLLMQSILYLPRNQSMQPINSIISLNYWGILLLMYFLIFRRSEKNV